MTTKPDELEDLDYSLLVIIIRSLRRWNQLRLARESGKNKGEVSLYEAGKRRPRPKAIARLVRGARLAEKFSVEALPLIRRLRILAGLGREVSRDDESADAIAARLVVPVGEAARAAAAPRLAALYASDEEADDLSEPPTAETPERVVELWGLLESLQEENDARILVENLPELWSEGLCRRLCDESERAAANDASRARYLADLALRVAQRVKCDAAEKAELKAQLAERLQKGR